MPRALGFALGAFCLATVLLLTTLVTGYLVAHALGLVAYSVWDFADLVLRAMKVQDFIFPPLKCITIGFVVALACCATGLGRRDKFRRAAAAGSARVRALRARHPGGQQPVRPGGLTWHSRSADRSSRCKA